MKRWSGKFTIIALGVLGSFACGVVTGSRWVSHETAGLEKYFPDAVAASAETIVENSSPPGTGGGVLGIVEAPCSDTQAEMLKRELDELRIACRLKEESETGTEIRWGMEIPRQYQPDAVTRSLKTAQEECPEVAQTHHYLNCDEYPCMIWAELPEGSSGYALQNCDAWPYHPEVLGIDFSVPEESNLTVSYLVMGVTHQAVPEEEYETFQKRTRYRIEFQRQIALDDKKESRR